MAGRQATANSRLSVDDWIEGGFGLLAEEGLSAIKVDRLCARLGVTKGSFYWHFTDMRAFLDAMSTRWGEVRDGARARFAELDALEPRERLAEMMAVLTDRGQWTLERAVREWARSDPQVAARVRESDRWIHRAVLAAFKDAGFDGVEAEVRARTLFYSGVGYIHVADGRDVARGAKQRALVLDILLRH